MLLDGVGGDARTWNSCSVIPDCSQSVVSVSAAMGTAAVRLPWRTALVSLVVVQVDFYLPYRTATLAFSLLVATDSENTHF